MKENSLKGAVCVVGAGTMGWGIAQVFAATGYKVYLCDQTEEQAIRGKQAMHKVLDKQVEKGRMEQAAKDQLLDRVVPCLIDAIGDDCVFAIEAVFESPAVKKIVFEQLEAKLPAEALITTNTSSLSITELACYLKDPGRLAGMHFFNPAPLMSLVEVIGGARTSEETLTRVCELATELGKTPVRVNEAPGFVVNRLLIPMVNEAIFLVSEGVADIESIDQAMLLGASHKIGPLQLGDLIGLDVCLAIMEVLHQETGDDKYRPAPLLRKMVRAGKLGRKTKQGFYEY